MSLPVPISPYVRHGYTIIASAGLYFTQGTALSLSVRVYTLCKTDMGLSLSVRVYTLCKTDMGLSLSVRVYTLCKTDMGLSLSVRV